MRQIATLRAGMRYAECVVGGGSTLQRCLSGEGKVPVEARPALALLLVCRSEGRKRALQVSHNRLAALRAAHQAALETQLEAGTTHESILRILQALASHEINQRHAMRLLGLHALRSAEVPAPAARSRQVAASLRQVQREEQ
jgi:hypothetical protein